MKDPTRYRLSLFAAAAIMGPAAFGSTAPDLAPRILSVTPAEGSAYLDEASDTYYFRSDSVAIAWAGPSRSEERSWYIGSAGTGAAFYLNWKCVGYCIEIQGSVAMTLPDTVLAATIDLSKLGLAGDHRNKPLGLRLGSVYQLFQDTEPWFAQSSDYRYPTDPFRFSGDARLYVDTEAPEIAAGTTIEPIGWTSVRRPSLTFRFVDSGSGIGTAVLLDGARVMESISDPQPRPDGSFATQPLQKDLGEGTHNLTCRVTDRAGNSSESTAPYTIHVDTTPPRITDLSSNQGRETLEPLRFTTARAPLFTISATDGGGSGIASGTGDRPYSIAYSLGGGSRGTIEGASAIAFDVAASGDYELRFRVQDRVGLSSGIDERIAMQKILAEPPQLSLRDATSDGWYNEAWFEARGGFLVTIADALGEAVARAEYRIRKADTWKALARTESANDFRLEIPQDGEYPELEFRAIDEAGNQGSLGQPVKLDRAAPALVLDIEGKALSPSEPCYASPRRTIGLRASDNLGLCSIEYYVDANAKELRPIAANAASFVPPLEGSHSYTFSIKDQARNESSAAYSIVFNTEATSLGPLDPTSGYSTLSYVDAATKRSRNLIPTEEMGADELLFSFAPTRTGGQTKWGGSYAPPASVSVSVAGFSSTLEFSASGSGVYQASWALPGGPEGIADGRKTAAYTLRDRSGLSSTGSFEFILHRSRPSALAPVHFGRDEGAGWQAPAQGGSALWSISRSDALELARGARRDGIRIRDYVDASDSGGQFTGYTFIISDERDPDAAMDGASYGFLWGGEDERVLSFRVKSGAGILSEPFSLALIKPRWSGSAPAKVVDPGAKAFSLVWSDLAESPVPCSAKSVLWGEGYSSSIAFRDHRAVLAGGICGKKAGERIQYRCVIDEDQSAAAACVLGARIVGEGLGFTIPFESLPPFSMPASLRYLPERGKAAATGLARIADDGAPIFYSLTLSLKPSGSQSKAARIVGDAEDQEYPGAIVFSLNLRDLAKSPPADLRAFLGSSLVHLKLTGGYDDPAEPPAGKPSLSLESDALWDLDPPAVLYSGMMSRGGIIASDKKIEGSVTDAGGSQVASIRIGWALVEEGVANREFRDIAPRPGDACSFSHDLGPGLPDGRYLIQVEATDGAGNRGFGLVREKIFDTRAPSLKSLSFIDGVGVEAGTGAYLAHSDGSVSIRIRTDDSGGLGLASVEYAWVDSSAALLGSGWASAAVPGASLADPAPEGVKERLLSLTAPPATAARLLVRLVDGAGNSGGELSNPSWIASYDPVPPAIAKLAISGIRESMGSYYAKSASELSASYAGLPGVAERDLRWNIVTLDPSGSIDLTKPHDWSNWGAGLASLRPRIATDGRRYQIQLQARNANGLASGTMSGTAFVLDSRGPVGVSARLSGAKTAFIAGEPIGIIVAGSDPYSGLAWSWTRQRTDAPGSPAVSEAYVPGSDIAISLSGGYRITLSAESGSGIRVQANPIDLTIGGSGLVVRDYRRYCDGYGLVGGSWDYAAGKPASYRHRWKTQGGALIRDWLPGDSTQSSLLKLSESPAVLAAGDVVQLEVQALGAGGELLAAATSLGCRIDDSPPEFSKWLVPACATPWGLWVEYEASDAQSGIAGASLLVKKVGPGGVEGTWERELGASSGPRRIEIDLSASGFATGDRVVVELSLSDGAGLATTRTSGIVILDGSPPPLPLVTVPVDVLRYRPSDANPEAGYDTLGCSWGFSRPDPESGTVAYFWKAYADEDELEDSAWTELAEPGTTAVAGLDYSERNYTGAGTYAEGTVLRFAVKAVNGAGLASVGYSRGIILDSRAPLVMEVAALDIAATPIRGYVAMEKLRRVAGGPAAVFALINASDAESGLSRFAARAGTYDPASGFAADPGGPVLAFSLAEAEGGGREGYRSPELASTSPIPGSIWMIRGRAYDAADNERSLFSSPFKIAESLPRLASLAATIGPEELGFAWTVEEESDLVQDYLVSLRKMEGGKGSPIPIDANPSLATFAKSLSFGWKGLGLRRGDRVECRVLIEYKGNLGISSEKTVSIVIAPEAPLLAAFEYSAFFRDRVNVKTLAYAPGDGKPGGEADVESIQWRLLDARTGSPFQDWRTERGGPSISLRESFSALSRSPVHGDRLYIETRAKSRMGLWSSIGVSRVLGVDATFPESVSISRGGPYSNAPGGRIPGWKLAALDPESGILAYQTILAPAAEAGDPAALDWEGRGSLRKLSLAPGHALDEGEASLEFGPSADGEYVAFLRIKNGTEEWCPPAMSGLVSVNRVKPRLSIVFADRVIKKNGSGASLATKITNFDSEAIGLCSSKELTRFSASVNGIALEPGALPEGIEGSYGQAGVKSYAIMTLRGQGIRDIEATGTDAYGNESTVLDSLRFNEAPTIRLLRATTTPAQVLELERLVDAYDASADYPMTYRWSLGGGTAIDGLEPYQGGPTSSWGAVPYHRAMYSQRGKNQATAYSLGLSLADAWGKTATVSIPIEVRNTESGTLFADEYWSGERELLGMVEVPAGIVLSLDGAAVRAKGSLVGGFLASGIMVKAGGRLVVVEGVKGASSLSTGVGGYLWKGIDVQGRVEGGGLWLFDAERALVLEPGGSMSLINSRLRRNLIGLHLLGGSLELSSSELSDNAEYGVKEDATGSFLLRGNGFHGNGVDYYELRRSRIGMGELNSLGGNSGNARY